MGSKPQRGTITWKLTRALLLAMFGVTFLSAVLKGSVCDYCSLPTAAQDINVIDEFVAFSSALLCVWWLLVAVLWVLKRIGMCPAAAALLYSKLTTP